MFVTDSSHYLYYCTPSTTNVMKVRLDVYIVVFSPFHRGNKVDDGVKNRDRSLVFFGLTCRLFATSITDDQPLVSSLLLGV